MIEGMGGGERKSRRDEGVSAGWWHETMCIREVAWAYRLAFKLPIVCFLSLGIVFSRCPGLNALVSACSSPARFLWSGLPRSHAAL
jgi:hypothetical protein